MSNRINWATQVLSKKVKNKTFKAKTEKYFVC